jgi:hypothetical protein
MRGRKLLDTAVAPPPQKPAARALAAGGGYFGKAGPK